MSEQVQLIIQSNLDLIYSGFYRDHEHLDKLFKKVPTFGVHLAAMYTWMKDHPAPFVTDKKENEYWSMPMSALIAKHGGTAETWQSHIILMHLLGLLKRSRPDKRSVLPEMKKAYVKAIENHQRSMSFYSPVEFNAETIDAAEQEAKKIIESGMSAGHITKADIIRHYGKNMANRLYADLRKVSVEEQHVIDVMVEVIRSNVRRNGYTVPDEVIRFSLHTLYEEAGDDQDLRDSYKRLVKKYMVRKKDICSMAGCVYRQQTKEDHERLGTTENFWIIVTGA